MSRGSYVAAIAVALAVALIAPIEAQAAASAQKSECLRATFYSPADWLRLATKLAAHNVSCAQYYVTIPPLAAEKTTFRPDQPWRIRALGPNYHAVAEISYNGWSRWIAANGSTWFDAGVEARRRMAAQGFDVADGDTWAINESSSAVRTGAGLARQNLRDLVRGLYTGAGGPTAKGIVFVVGVGQTGASLSTYKGTLQLWFADEAFWSDMSSYVSDWSQEVYGDVMKYAVAGATPDVRRDELNAWLQHPLSLANAGPDDVATAQTYLQTAYSPLANAAWRYGPGSGFGGTDVPTAVMQDYVSAQVYAMRSAGTRLGFAWTPKRPEGETSSQFAAESGAVVDRLAAAIHDSAEIPEAACAEWCTSAVDGAWFNESWNDFTTWSTPTFAFPGAPVSATAGAVSGPLTVSLQLAGIARADVKPVAVTLSSSSPGATFATSADGPWTSTLAVEIPTGSTDAVFYYRDTVAGTPAISAAASGRTTAQQVETVTAGPLARIGISTPSLTLQRGKTYPLSASGSDSYGNSVAVSPHWSATIGKLTKLDGPTTTYKADKAGTATVAATSGGVTGTVRVTIR